MNFFWKVLLNEEGEGNTANVRTIVKVASFMPESHLRQIHHEFIEKYKNAVKSTNKSLMHFIYQYLVGDRSS